MYAQLLCILGWKAFVGSYQAWTGNAGAGLRVSLCEEKTCSVIQRFVLVPGALLFFKPSSASEIQNGCKSLVRPCLFNFVMNMVACDIAAKTACILWREQRGGCTQSLH